MDVSMQKAYLILVHFFLGLISLKGTSLLLCHIDINVTKLRVSYTFPNYFPIRLKLQFPQTLKKNDLRELKLVL